MHAQQAVREVLRLCRHQSATEGRGGRFGLAGPSLTCAGRELVVLIFLLEDLAPVRTDRDHGELRRRRRQRDDSARQPVHRDDFGVLRVDG